MSLKLSVSVMRVGSKQMIFEGSGYHGAFFTDRRLTAGSSIRYFSRPCGADQSYLRHVAFSCHAWLSSIGSSEGACCGAPFGESGDSSD